ncbi:hypothetical protein QP919_07530 [Corynebacterium propinquum]|uniref:hypothetical protein n=1 Tax=Corynebacterium propinquum TaxID=43769 RepID=UPI000F85EF16|nr:hypothetical protein [Corynebacterium propinquum]MDK8723244.1 hypothetical protein [Corynebacterium propinquum]RUP80187.1 hypothetical protein D8M24_00610 [Corynebacterium propinquum]RUP90415.1 hypothetical protein D8M40_00610 [Corynebacterium propinquum]RUP97205.1 hypothetical protein D8M20_02050 [Corynebacterium propinquum]WKS27744.1 hypothetical protein NLL49_00280 [Corynebacterium propinquum]
MRTTKRALVAAVLSIGIVTPLASNIAPHAQAAPSHLGCGRGVVEDAGFQGNASVVVAKHLKVSCGLSVEQISKLTDAQLTQVIEDIGISRQGFSPALVRAAAPNIDQGTDRPRSVEESDDFDQGYQTGVDVDELKAGARKVTGRVYLQADQDQQKISAAFPGRHFVTITALKQNPGKAELVHFEIPVPDDVELREHHQVFVYTGEGTPTPQRVRNGGAMLLVTASDKDSAAMENQLSVLVDDIVAGARTVTGKVKLPSDVTEQKIAAFFPRSLFGEVTVRKTEADTAGAVTFEIAVPESLNLRAGDQVKIGPVGSPADIQSVTVKPAS